MGLNVIIWVVIFENAIFANMMLKCMILVSYAAILPEIGADMHDMGPIMGYIWAICPIKRLKSFDFGKGLGGLKLEIFAAIGPYMGCILRY